MAKWKHMGPGSNRTGAKDGAGRLYRSSSEIQDLGSQPTVEDGFGAKDGGGGSYSQGSAPKYDGKGMGLRHEPGGKPGSVLQHRMENLHNDGGGN